jgi:hypothetical protein
MQEKPRIIVVMNFDHEEMKRGERYEVDSDQAIDLVKKGLANFSSQADVTQQPAAEKIEGKAEKKEKEPKTEPTPLPEEPSIA